MLKTVAHDMSIRAIGHIQETPHQGFLSQSRKNS